MTVCQRFVFCLLILLINNCVNAQQTEESKEQCKAAYGWAYSSSVSSAAGSGSGGGIASAICVLAKLPSQCIRAHPACSWCAQSEFSASRCNIEVELRRQNCNSSLIYMVKSQVSLGKSRSSSESSSLQRFSFSTGEVRVRVGDTVQIPFEVSEPPVYPVDFYYLMDVSFSMLDDLNNVKSLGKALVEKLEDLTHASGIEGKGTVRLGFGKFVDKVQSPMTQMTPYKLKHPYKNFTDAPFLFKNVVKLTSDVSEFEDSLKNETVSGNLDPPEGALDAMLQVVQCKDVIGWRNYALRLLMVATESTFHYADDGAGYLSGIVKQNDGKCHTDKGTGNYMEAEDQDYPSISQVVQAIEKNSITPIFAVKSVYADLYKQISEEYFKGSTSGVLGNDSTNVVALVEEAYRKISGQQELVTDNPDDTVLCPWYTYTLNNNSASTMAGSIWDVGGDYAKGGVFAGSVFGVGNASDAIGTNNDVATGTAVGGTQTGKASEITVSHDPDGNILINGGGAADGITVLPVEETQVTGLKSGAKVYYSLYLGVNRDSCLPSEENPNAICNLGNVEIKARRFDEKISLHTKVIGAFDCEEFAVVDSIVCNEHGRFVCGICQCSAGWTGPKCNIADVPGDGCTAPGASKECSGRGVCINGRCQCDHGHRHEKDKIFGDYCECDECPKRAGRVCSNHGNPTKVGCKCTCECFPGWTGHDCSCQQSMNTCMSANGEICSGQGTCSCGRCTCNPNSGFGGPTCSSCLKDCMTCVKIQDCVQCTMYSTGPKNGSCSECAERHKFLSVERDTITQESVDANVHEMCAALDATDNCKFYFKYQKLPSDKIEIHAESEKRCKPAYSLLIIIWCILLVLLIGLILLCCWRCCVYVIDKEEEKNYRLSSLAKATAPGLIPLLPAMGASNVVEFIKAKYLVRQSAKLAVVPVRRNFFAGKTGIRWRTYPGSAGDDDYEVLNDGEAGTLARKKNVERVHAASGQTVEMEPLLAGGNGAPMAASGGKECWGERLRTVDETDAQYPACNWGEGELLFADGDEFASIKIPVVHNFPGRQAMFWVELYNQERGVALGLKRTKVIVLKDEDAGVLGFPKSSCVFKENDQRVIVPVHRTVGMDGKVSVRWFTRDLTAIDKKHYIGGSGILEFEDGEVTKHIDIELIPDLIYDDVEKAFNLELEDPKGGASLDLSHCMVTILCNEECAVLQFAKTAYPFMENCGNAEIPVVRTRNTKGTCTVRWKTEDQSAFAGKDYEKSEGMLTFPNLVTEAYVQIPIIDNNDYDENGRSFIVYLYDPDENAKLAQDVTTISIIEDDVPGIFEFAKTNIVLRKTELQPLIGHFPLVRSLGTDGNVKIPWSVQAHEDQELPPGVASMSGSVDFIHGEITHSLELLLPDVPQANVFSFDIKLIQPTGGGKLGAKCHATVTVFGEEDTGYVSFAQSRFEAMATSGMATLLVSRKGSLDNAAFVMYETMDCTAISGTHYRGGTSSIVFDAGEPVKEVGIPVYNDPDAAGRPLIFNVALKSTPGGPKIGDNGTADVVVTCIKIEPNSPVTSAPGGHCTVELLKSKYLVRKSAKTASVPVHKSFTEGDCVVEWTCILKQGVTLEKARCGSHSSSSSMEDEEHMQQQPMGRIEIPDGFDHGNIILDLSEMEIFEPQVSLSLILLNTYWTDEYKVDGIELGKKKAEVVVLNDIDPGTLGFSKATYSFKSNDGQVSLPVHRLGGMDGEVTVEWFTRNGTAKLNEDFLGERGVVRFGNNEIMKKIEIKVLPGQYGLDESEKQFTIELGQVTGGSKIGTRMSTVKILGGEDQSVVQFSKSSYPVIGTSTSIKIPLLRTGDCQSEVTVRWYTEDGTAKQGIDYKQCMNSIVFPVNVTRAEVEIPLSGKTMEPRTFKAHLDATGMSNVNLGQNETTTIAIISSREPGTFEFNKSSFVFKTTAECGLVPVTRSNGTDGEVNLPWKIESLPGGEQSPFEGAEGFLHYDDGQVSASVEVGLQDVPTTTFVLVLLPPEDGGKLGAASRTTVSVIGEMEEPIIQFASPTLFLQTCEVVRATVIRHGNTEEMTCVGWKTDDGTARNGEHFVGGSGNIVFDPHNTSKDIVIPVLQPPTKSSAEFRVRLTEVMGPGQLGDTASIDVTLEPVESHQYSSVLQQAAAPETYVEFLRKRHHFAQSLGTALVPVHRSDTKGDLVLHYDTANISQKIARRGLSPSVAGEQSLLSLDEEQAMQRYASKEEIDWGSGVITFEDGERETAIELMLYRDFPGRDSNFKIALSDPCDKVNFGVQETIITVLKDRDAGSLGFAKQMYEFSCSDKQLVIPVHRSLGADGTVSVPWATRDGSAIGGTHYLPDDGNLVFRDGEVVQKIAVPMPLKTHIFGEDEVAFDIVLGEPTGGASLQNIEAKVVLNNDIVPSAVAFLKPFHECEQSKGTVCVPVIRSEGHVGRIVIPWRAVSTPGKPRSRYDGTNNTITFKEGEEQLYIEFSLPKGLQPSDQDYFVLELEEPKTGRAYIGQVNQCHVTVNNDISAGAFSFSAPNYSFNQSEGRGCVTVTRTNGTEGEASLSWKMKSNSTVPTVLHNKRGVIDFNPGQSAAKIEIPLPKDSENDHESYILSLSPPGGRGKLCEPKQAEVVLSYDVECSVGFTQPLYETPGDVDTLLLPVMRDGPKGRPVTVSYRMIDNTAKDLLHYIGEQGSINFGAGEDLKNLLIPILNDPSGERVVFDVELHSVQGPGRLNVNARATVAIDNLAGPGIFIMASSEMEVNQSSKTACITVLRTHGRKGDVELPWFVEQVQSVKGGRKPRSYDSIEGKLLFNDGEGQKVLEIPLECSPQDSPVTKFDAVLMTPTGGSGAALGDVTTTTVTVNNDIDGGTLEMATDQVELSGTDKEVIIPVVRTGAIDSICYVTWETEDLSAVRGKHYKGGRGNLSFEPGEKSKKITIPIVNDPAGDVTSFNVCLGETKGGAKLGEKTKTEVITNHVREHGEIFFEEPRTQFQQSAKTITLTLIRKTGSTGRVVVPWTVHDVPEKSPYYGLKGQERFGDGETETHIEIALPTAPQENEQEPFKVVLGQPLGGAFLSGESECLVSVENDVPHAYISFQDETCNVCQSDKSISLPIVRSKRTQGRVRVPWETNTDIDASYYNALSGVEVFEDKEKKSHIEIQLSNVPSDAESESFQVVLNQPKSPEAKLGNIQACTVVVLNDIELPPVTFGKQTQEALQSESRTYVAIRRLRHPSGRVIIPWKLVPELPDSPYTGIVGETVLEDGDMDCVAEIHLPQVPLDKPKETVAVILEDPIGGKLVGDAMCRLMVANDVGEGIIEMKSPTLTCSSDDGRAQVMVVRKISQDFPAELQYITEDGDAIAGQHYDKIQGELKFRPGEHERPIPVNLINDPTGETRHFKVKLIGLKGRDKFGDVIECRVTITNEATPPPPVPGFTASLTGPQSIHAKWLPVDGAPFDGYKVSYWSKPGTSKTIKLSPADTEITLEPLAPSTTYQILVCAYNDVGEGPTSGKVVLETDPETRLSYDSPIQFKTSMHIARFTISRTQTNFKSTFTYKVFEEKQKKLPRPYDSSSSTPSSSSSEEEKETLVPLQTSELTFEPGQSTLTVEMPLEQDMKKMSGIYFVKVYGQSKTEKPIANVELHVINDTGVPGHVRTPFCASMAPKECMVTWEPPVGGGPVKGYEVVARTKEHPDVVADVSDGALKVLLTDLQPSTKYNITVQPYNNVGRGKRSMPGVTTTQDEMKVEFAERFYTFKMSDKVAVIPIKRHFAHGYTTLKWHTQWSKTQEEPESSSSSDEEETAAQDPGAHAWASGAITFADGQNTANVQIPLRQAASPTQKKRSFFWLYILDPNKRKRLGAMKCGLVDDKARVTPPRDANAEATGSDSVLVSWNPESVAAQEYWVSFKRAGSRDDASRRTVTAETGQLVIADLKPESTYAIVVTAVGDGGKQASTEVMSCTTPGNVPGPPNRLVFQVLSPTSLQCSWGEPANPNGVITSYEVLYELINESQNETPILVQIPDGHYRSLLVEDLNENEPYKYSVRAKNQWGFGPFRHADMKIEHVGSRPPSAIFLDANDTTYIQQQQEFMRKEQENKERKHKREEMSMQLRQTQFDPTENVTSTQSTKTRVTRYMQKEGQVEPVKETMEYEGRLSQEDLAKMAEEGGRLEVQVLTYNTTQRMQSGGGMQSYHQSSPGEFMQELIDNPEFRSDSRREVVTDVEEFTDVQESNEGDADVTTTTKMYKTTTTERQLDTRSGVRRVVYSSSQQQQKNDKL